MNARDARIHVWGAQVAALDWHNRSLTAIHRAIHIYAMQTETNFILLNVAVHSEAFRLYDAMVQRRARRHCQERQNEPGLAGERLHIPVMDDSTIEYLSTQGE